MTTGAAVERRMATLETALAEERTSRLRAERSLTDARTAIHDLKGRLAVAQRSLQVDRESRQKAEEAYAAAARSEPAGSPSTAVSRPDMDNPDAARSQSSETPKPRLAGRSRSKVVKWWVKG
jgi:hypothetical protein